ncbi:MAG: hypothetical protein M1820_008313 [Bogoriella megaspora]|nr:MAG: hypothetical protein M1820_008313 [Bogoriella megaspora]
MEYEKCYVLDTPIERPSKKRKIDNSGLQGSWDRRKKLYQEQWARQEQRFHDVLQKANHNVISDITDFVANESPITENSKIPTGIIVGGPDLSSQVTLFTQLESEVKNLKSKSGFVSLSSRDASNLKNLLKVLIQRATSRNEGVDEDEEEPTSRRRGPRLLNYDLQILRDWRIERGIERVVVAFEDSEAFDSSLLAEVLDVLSTSRIPIVLLFGIATSVENFEDRIPRAIARNFRGQKFDAVQADDLLEQVFEASIDDVEQQLWLGSGLSRMLLDRQKDHIQSIQAFIDSIKYAYMSHFYANPLSLFLDPNLDVEETPKGHLQAARNLTSFRNYVEECLDVGQADHVRSMLDSDADLLQCMQKQVQQGQQGLRNLVTTLKLIRFMRSIFQQSTDVSLYNLFVKGIAGELNQSLTIRELLLSMKKSDSDMLSSIIDLVRRSDDAALTKAAKPIVAKFDRLMAKANVEGEPLRSEHDIRHKTMRTTVVAQKVELSKQKASLTKQDSDYSKIVQELHAVLEGHFQLRLVNPKDMFTNEIFMYDAKSPHRDSFTPKPRFVIERALSAPHDYLNCSCCQVSGDRNEETTLLPSNPPTSILYQLYLESGALINVSDLYTAFHATVGKDEDDEKRVMALFQRALAELKYMGFMKPSRKKLDHVAKLAWKGL